LAKPFHPPPPPGQVTKARASLRPFIYISTVYGCVPVCVNLQKLDGGGCWGDLLKLK
jgi:hypothetical protein